MLDSPSFNRFHPSYPPSPVFPNSVYTQRELITRNSPWDVVDTQTMHWKFNLLHFADNERWRNERGNNIWWPGRKQLRSGKHTSCIVPLFYFHILKKTAWEGGVFHCTLGVSSGLLPCPAPLPCFSFITKLKCIPILEFGLLFNLHPPGWHFGSSQVTVNGFVRTYPPPPTGEWNAITLGIGRTQTARTANH